MKKLSNNKNVKAFCLTSAFLSLMSLSSLSAAASAKDLAERKCHADFRQCMSEQPASMHHMDKSIHCQGKATKFCQSLNLDR